MPKFVYVGPRADTLGDGRPLAPGDAVTLDAEAQKDPHNKRLIDEELLLAPQKREQRKEGDK